MKPILFNTEMVRAILDGRKTVTRRVIKPQPYEVCFGGVFKNTEVEGKKALVIANRWDELEMIFPPYCHGDILYVRETWAKDPFGAGYIYPTEIGGAGQKWHPSIHMPREAARIFLRVTDMRVERLQDIDDEGAKAEGSNWRNGKNVGFEEKMRRSAVARFAENWDNTIKPADRALYGWNANPWVWVIEFERCESPCAR